MTRTEREGKYANVKHQRADGSWYTARELQHDTRYCDICDSTDVEQPSELVTMDGWYGGVRVFWGSAGSAHQVIISEVLCRQHRDEHWQAEQSAKRYNVEVDSGQGFERELVYFCPAHQREEVDYRGDTLPEFVP